MSQDILNNYRVAASISDTQRTKRRSYPCSTRRRWRFLPKRRLQEPPPKYSIEKPCVSLAYSRSNQGQTAAYK